MIKKVGIYLIFLSFLFVFFTANTRADVYSWVDEKGITHYSTTPPQGDTDLKVTIYPSAKPTKTNTTTPVKNTIENIKSTLKSIVTPVPTPTPTPTTTITPTPKKDQTSKPKVELYIASWCPWCQKAIAFFKAKDVELTIYDVEKDEEAAQRKEQLDAQKGIPFAVVNGHPIHGYVEKAYNDALKQ